MFNNTANATYNLGRVGMNLRGEYDPTATYEMLDVVTWRGGSYAARAAATGIAPSAEDSWMPLAQGLAPYSVGEQKTGSRWIDGRPVYRRAFDITKNLPSGTVLFAIDDMDALLTCSGCIVEGNGAKRPFGSAYSSDNEYGVYALNNNNLIVQTLGGGVGARAYGYVEYTKTTDAPTYYHLPYLTAASNQGCVITASSEFDANFQRVYAFMGPMYSRYWATTVADTERWIQVEMPYKLTNMIVTLMNPAHANPVPAADQPVAGTFLGSNDASAWTQLGTFADRPTTEGAVTRHELNNATGYKYLRVQVTQPGAGVWTGFADVRVEGEVATEADG